MNNTLSNHNAFYGGKVSSLKPNKSFLQILFMFHLVFIFSTLNLAAATYYVSPAGSDSNPGNQSAPWRTIQKAANTLIAGDMVYIMAGTYNERVTPQNSGNANNWITYAAYPGDLVVIDGTGLSSGWNGVFKIFNKGYIKVTGLKIQKSPGNGFLIENSNYIILENNHTFDTYNSGIGVWNCTNVIIDGNNVERACNGGSQECITIAKTDGFEVRNNEVHSTLTGANGGEGIDAKDGSRNGKIYNNYVHNLKRIGIYVDAWNKHTYNIQVYNNIVHDCDDGFAVASEEGGLLENVSFFNNVAYHNEWRGIIISGCCGTHVSHPLKNVLVINNTFYNNGWTNWGGGIHIENHHIENLIVRNNIVSQNKSFQIALEGPIPLNQLTVEYNLIHGFKNYPGEIRGTNYIESNPLFVNPSTYDLRLQSGSPAVDAGTPLLAPLFDILGNIRPIGAGFDIGAYEYGSLTNTNENFSSFDYVLYQNYPNPFNPRTEIKFSVSQKDFVTIKVYDILGNEVSTLLAEEIEAGKHSVNFYANSLSSGVYFYRMSTQNFSETKRMLLLK